MSTEPVPNPFHDHGISWDQLLRERLGLPELLGVHDTVPFGLPPVADAEWRVERLEVDEHTARLTARTASGLEGIFAMQFFPDTRAVECWGEVTHRGTEPLRGVSQSLVLDAALRLSDAFDRPWVRSVGGAPLSTFFPPRDFGTEDHQLITRARYPYRLSSATNGRTTYEHLPCAILGDRDGTRGLAFMLEWAGLWSISLGERRTGDGTELGDLRVRIGIWGLDLTLEPGQSVPLPRLLMVGYDGGLDAGGNALRRHIRAHVAPRLDGREVLPPTSFNQWFAFGNDFDADLMKPAVDASAEAGLEYFCVDGGWFEGGFPEGIGNWDSVDPQKFPEGIAAFADYVRSKGLKYGTWFEPEWAHVSSSLYREHPEWFWTTPAWTGPWEPNFSPQFQSADYALMDFGLPEVQQWWVDRIRRAYDEWGVRWIRWDFNHSPRPNWEDVEPGQVGWRQIRHVQGLYLVLDEIMHACPDLFLEQCATGGMRIELGLVRRGHSFWMDDVTMHSDLVRAFQHGLNTVLPGNYANTNLCQPRHDFSDYDFLSHATGGFGYSGRLWEAPAEDLERITRAIADFRSYRHLLLGDYERTTGRAMRADDYECVTFTDGGERLTVEYNHDGRRTARFAREALPGD